MEPRIAQMVQAQVRDNAACRALMRQERGLVGGLLRDPARRLDALEGVGVCLVDTIPWRT